ncbi:MULTISPECIES: site-specific integrase [Clostridia]|uniref:site-specific integrase n=1 Tax=Clostridia TaxID=186801 RepID=UPI0018F461CB|nr:MULTISPECIES: site-specific integrase [Clostridia]
MKYDKERFYTLAFSGMRSGELCALQKNDLDFKENTINIEKTIYNEKNNMRGYELTTPKTDGSIRLISMEQSVMDMLRKVVQENDKHKMQYRTLMEDYHDKDFVFARANGYPFVTKTILTRMNRLMRKTNIKKYAIPHIFRHTHISMLSKAGVDIATIMKRVGHEDIDTTMRIYTHVTDKMKKDATEKISNLYGNILKKSTF